MSTRCATRVEMVALDLEVDDVCTRGEHRRNIFDGVLLFAWSLRSKWFEIKESSKFNHPSCLSI